SRHMKAILSVLVAVGTLAATEVLAQAPASAVQSGREFRQPGETGKTSRTGRAQTRTKARDQAHRPDRQGALDARAQQRVVAPAPFDGSWSVAINTESGACEPSYRFRVEIIDGDVVYEGQPAGRVSPNGGVWVNVSSGGQQATGQGRLARNYGSGVWRGYGSAGSCAGFMAGRAPRLGVYPLTRSHSLVAMHLKADHFCSP